MAPIRATIVQMQLGEEVSVGSAEAVAGAVSVVLNGGARRRLASADGMLGIGHIGFPRETEETPPPSVAVAPLAVSFSWL